MRRVSEIEDIGPEPGFSPRAVGYRRATPVTVSRASDEAEKDVSVRLARPREVQHKRSRATESEIPDIVMRLSAVT